ncbi:putative cysteine protease [Neoasaia chiangmaiensis NBRC 101099]|uniref:Uncharacterized protein n=1 Tax=Neoasaia chiangmaiensis TaxID=320497 RepID=A0A1U9KPM4_9PROT|nr:transglutaminase family protein [Neoasaia chiangmaiensis]AQS87728.1 hypothetical protein A0U93_07045 [Neoasaia chiangmaiensis]GBR41726.1 putative cysteine protease [Neoasaia chiangmaiensis NBRC 101099]GEN14322.1 transglutaminase [Neoasaia chiangmaiensis]
MPILSVEHTTIYRYRRSVGFGEHRLLGRPRDSADQILQSWSVEISPAPVAMRHVQDVFGNVVTSFTPAMRAQELRVVNRLRLDHTPVTPRQSDVARYAATWPFGYDAAESPDLGRLREPSIEDADHAVGRWARRFLRGAETPTLDLLSDMTQAIDSEFSYRARFEEGTQSPARTLALCSGTCRDYAVLMIEAVRSLGFAARFVTGYLYSPRGEHHHGGGATHAWLEVFVPGLGWVDFDPTNGIVGSRDLIRVASVRDWRQAVPLAGTWNGLPADFLGMDVTVRVTDASADTALPVPHLQAL